MSRYDYNLIAIGAGAAGLVTSLVGAKAQARVALIEKHLMGGDCLNTGCVPSKALIASAKVAHLVQNADRFGLQASGTVDFARVMEQVQDTIARIAPNDSVERFTSLGVECFSGAAQVRSPHEVEVEGKRLSARTLVIATGARPRVPEIPGLSECAYSTSDTLWNLRTLPRKLGVIGGGPIGCELAQAFARLGSEVVVFNAAPRLLSREDPEVSAWMEQRFDAEGISVRNACTVEAAQAAGTRTRLTLQEPGHAEPTVWEGDHLLVATGRQPNTTGFGLEELGVALNADGTIQVDATMRSSIPSLYACGDVAGPYQFTHLAGHQAWYAAVNALFSPLKAFRVDYRTVPWCTYTDPEVARVGLNEQEAQTQQVPYEVTRFDLAELDRAITDRVDQGFLKILTPPGKDRLLGVTLVGAHAGDLLAEYVLAMKHGLGLNRILGTIHPYPTLAESSKLAAGRWRQRHVPSGVLPLLKWFHTWRRR